MSAIPAQDKAGSLQTMWRWLRSWPERIVGDLAAVDDREVEQIAKDIGVSSAELQSLARSDAKDADLLLQRMAALDLDDKEVTRLEPATMHDLQRLCTLCRARKRCVRDLARAPLDPRWKDYCPNAATLLALDAMPWASRREW